MNYDIIPTNDLSMRFGIKMPYQGSSFETVLHFDH